MPEKREYDERSALSSTYRTPFMFTIKQLCWKFGAINRNNDCENENSSKYVTNASYNTRSCSMLLFILNAHICDRSGGVNIHTQPGEQSGNI